MTSKKSNQQRKNNSARSRRKREGGARLADSPSMRHIVVERQIIQTVAKAASDSGNYRAYALSGFPDADIVSMFQEYRIKRIKLSWVLVNAPNNNASFPTVYVAPQHIFTGSVPTSRDEVIQYRGIDNYQFGPCNLTYSRSFVPHVAIDASTSGRKFEPSPWLSTVTDTVPHYTNVEWISRYNTTTDPTHTVELIAHAIIECRGTR